MTDYFGDLFASHRFQLVATGVVSGLVIGGLVLGIQALEREQRISELKNSIPSLDESITPKRLTNFGASSGSAVDKEDAHNQALARRAQAGDWDDDLILEQLARNRIFLTDEGLQKVRDSFVIIVGCGGVGGHCAAALARSGISRLRLIDFDQVTLSSLNRHPVATLADVGTPKVQCLQRRLIAVAPWITFELCQEKFEASVAERLLSPWPETNKPASFIVDAIDNIDTKIQLLKFCHDRKLPIISSMGAGAKSDPTRILLGDIGTSTYDSLSRSTRKRLKLQGITSGIPAVYSTEEAGEGKAELQPLAESEFQKGTVGDLGVMPNFRVRILPVLGTIPAVFGLTLANHILLSIAGYPMEYVAGKNRDKMYEGILAFLQGSEERITRLLNPNLKAEAAVGLRLPITPGDIAFLVEELYRGRSVVTGLPSRLVLVRWERTETSFTSIGEGTNEQKCSTVRLRDLVCMTRDEASRHEKAIYKEKKDLTDVYDQDVLDKVEQRQATAASYEKFR